MTLKKAIEILTLHLQTSPHFLNTDLKLAHKLGIEALKVVKFNRQSANFNYYVQLPGETPE